MRIGEVLVEQANYNNWDHQESADYSKYLEKHFGSPDEFTNEQTVWHNIDGFKRVVCRDEDDCFNQELHLTCATCSRWELVGLSSCVGRSY